VSFFFLVGFGLVCKLGDLHAWGTYLGWFLGYFLPGDPYRVIWTIRFQIWDLLADREGIIAPDSEGIHS
jgi:hypothetical protein